MTLKVLVPATLTLVAMVTLRVMATAVDFWDLPECEGWDNIHRVKKR